MAGHPIIPPLSKHHPISQAQAPDSMHFPAGDNPVQHGEGTQIQSHSSSLGFSTASPLSPLSVEESQELLQHPTSWNDGEAFHAHANAGVAAMNSKASGAAHLVSANMWVLATSLLFILNVCFSASFDSI